MRIPTSTDENSNFPIEEELYAQELNPKKRRGISAKLGLAWNFFLSAVQAKDIRHQYDKMTEHYFDLFGDSQGEYAQLLTRYVRDLKDLKQECALDLGAGSGILTIPMARLFEEVHAVDFSLNMLRHGQRENIKDVVWSQADVCHLPFADNSFDLVISSGLITHILPESFESFVQEMVRVCRPGGHVIVGVPPMPWRRVLRYRCPMDPNQLDQVIGFWYNLFHKALGMNENRCGYTRDKIQNIFKSNGVEVEFTVSGNLGLIHGHLKS